MFSKIFYMFKHMAVSSVERTFQAPQKGIEGRWYSKCEKVASVPSDEGGVAGAARPKLVSKLPALATARGQVKQACQRKRARGPGLQRSRAAQRDPDPALD